MYGYVYLIGAICLAAYALSLEIEYKRKRDKLNKENREWKPDPNFRGAHSPRFMPMSENYIDDLQKLKEIEK